MGASSGTTGFYGGPLLTTSGRGTLQSRQDRLLTVSEGDDLELDNSNELPYALVKNLGHGASAIVEMVRDINNNQTYARKVFRNYHTRRLADVKKAFQNELRVIRRLKSHHHIIRVFATYMAERELALILTPVADTGDLAAFLQHYRDLGLLNPDRDSHEAILWKAYGCLASGLAFIHQQTIRHKDIKPQNILIHQGRILYTDFGISFDFSEQGRSTTTGRPASFTRRYCAPEVAGHDNRNSKSDIFSLGCVYAEIFDALQPNVLPEAFLNGPFHTTLEQFPSKETVLKVPKEQAYSYILEVIRGMLALKSGERLSACDVTTLLPVSLDERELFCTSCFPMRRLCEKPMKETDIDTSVGISPLRPDNFNETSRQREFKDKAYIMTRFFHSLGSQELASPNPPMAAPSRDSKAPELSTTLPYSPNAETILSLTSQPYHDGSGWDTVDIFDEDEAFLFDGDFPGSSDGTRSSGYEGEHEIDSDRPLRLALQNRARMRDLGRAQDGNARRKQTSPPRLPYSMTTDVVRMPNLDDNMEALRAEGWTLQGDGVDVESDGEDTSESSIGSPAPSVDRPQRRKAHFPRPQVQILPTRNPRRGLRVGSSSPPPYIEALERIRLRRAPGYNPYVSKLYAEHQKVLEERHGSGSTYDHAPRLTSTRARSQRENPFKNPSTVEQLFARLKDTRGRIIISPPVPTTSEAESNNNLSSRNHIERPQAGNPWAAFLKEPRPHGITAPTTPSS